MLYSFYESLTNAHRVEARARFLLIHDILPVIKPHFFGSDKPAQWFLKLMRSVDPQKDWIACNSLCTKRDYCEYTGSRSPSGFCDPARGGALFSSCRFLSSGRNACAARSSHPGDFSSASARWSRRKNLVHVIRCFLRLIANSGPKFADVNLVLAGAKGWNYDAIFSEVEGAREWQSRIFFTGRVSDDDIAALYSAATGFIYLSLYEGFGLPPLEAMQCGTPVITSNTSSLPEVVGDAALAIDPTDEAALDAAMRTVLDDSTLSAGLRRKGLARAAQFSWDRFMDETVAAFRVALAESPMP